MWLLVLLVGLGNCSKSYNEAPNVKLTKLSDLEFRVLDGTLDTATSSVSGTGSLIFREPLKEKENNFELGFALKPGGSLLLATYTNNELKNGVNIKFSRTDNRLGVLIQIGTEIFERSTRFASVDASQPLSLNVDVHDHGDLVLSIGDQEESLTFKTRVSGTFWGLSLKDATVNLVKVAKAKHAD